MTRIVLKLMAEYDSWPLWSPPRPVGNVDPSTLPLTANLRHRLSEWAAAYDATLNRADPLRSGFASVSDEQAFVAEGCRLLEDIRRELGESYEVRFYHDGRAVDC